MPATFAPFVGTAGMSASFSAALSAAMPQPVGVQGGQSSNTSLGPRLSATSDGSLARSVTQATSEVVPARAEDQVMDRAVGQAVGQAAEGDRVVVDWAGRRRNGCDRRSVSAPLLSTWVTKGGMAHLSEKAQSENIGSGRVVQIRVIL